MVYQITIKDVQKALGTCQKNGVAVVVCSNAPQMSLAISFHIKDDGTVYYSPSYQVGNLNRCLPENYNLLAAIAEFNSEMRKYDDEHFNFT